MDWVRDEERFEDRADAGQQLAALLKDYAGPDTVVLALPRGGVVVGHEIAKALGVPLDVIVARKIGAPHQPELGMGAVAPGVCLIDEQIARYVGATPEVIDRIATAETTEMERRIRS